MAEPGGGLQTTLVAYSSSSSDSSSSSSPARSRSPQIVNSSLPRARTTQALPLPTQIRDSRDVHAPLPPANNISPPRAQLGRAPTRHADQDSASSKVHSALIPAKKTSPPRKVFVTPLSRNVKEAQLRQIFEDFGEVVSVEIPVDRSVNVPRSHGFVEFKKRDDAVKALHYMDGGQIDGQPVKLKFIPHRRTLSPAVAPPHALKGDARKEKGATGGENDSKKRRRESSPPRNRPSGSPPDQKVESPSRPSPKCCASSPTLSAMRSSSPGVGFGSQSPHGRPPGPPNQRVQRPPSRHGMSTSSHSTNKSSMKVSRKDV